MPCLLMVLKMKYEKAFNEVGDVAQQTDIP